MKNKRICGILNLTEEKKGTYPLTLARPIAGLPYACRYRLIDFPLTNLTTAGVDTIGIFINESTRSIYDHVRSGKEWGLDSVSGGLFYFSSLDDAQCGRSRSLQGDINNYFNNIEFIEKSGADYAVIMGTQNLCSVDIRAVLRSHIEQGAAITVVYKTVDRLPHDAQQLSCLSIGEDGTIKGLQSSIFSNQNGKAMINTDIYLMECSLLTKLIRNMKAENEHCDLTDVLHQAIVHLPSNGFEYTGYFHSIHSVLSYYQANMEMLQDGNLTALFKGSQSIHTKVKNEAPTYYGRTSDVRDAMAANGCLIHGTVNHSLLFRNVTVEKKAMVQDSIIMQGSIIGSGSELKYVILDKHVRIEPNTKLIGSREHPIVIEKHSVISRIYEQRSEESGKVYHLNGNG